MTGTAALIPSANFYPRPPRGGRRAGENFSPASAIFLSTPSARRATTVPSLALMILLFLSTPSARRATRRRNAGLAVVVDFYPRPPRGGRL